MKKILIAFLSLILIAPAMAYRVSATVADSTGPIIGAAVYQTDKTGNGTQTDENGAFTLNVPSEDTQLTFSIVGYETQNLSAKHVNDNSPIVLSESTEYLDSVVVTGGNKPGDKCNPKEANKDSFASGYGEWTKKNLLSPSLYCKVENCIDGFKPDKKTNRCAVDCSAYTTKLNATEAQNKSTQPTETKSDGDYSSFCYPTKCHEPEYKLDGTGESATCICNTPLYKQTENATCEYQVGKTCNHNVENANGNTGHNEWRNGKLVCKPDGCDGTNYVLEFTNDNYMCKPQKDRKVGDQCVDNELQPYPHAATGTITNWNEKDGKVEACKITACDDGWNVKESENKCVSCGCNEQWNKSTEKCETITDKDCTKSIVGATSAELDCKDGKSYCKLISCDTANGYELTDNKCECTATGFEKNKDGTCTPKKVLSADQYQNEIKGLADNAQKMHDKETSLENRMIGAAGIGGVGAGGMMLGAAISETAADADAEEKMTAYLASFRCDYGNGKGKTINGGETNVELPGGNDMIPLYTQYAQLANDLKTRKNALGMRPGIESEIVIDKSETGLYDDVGTGITGGAYASIARAILDPTGADAAKWAVQKETTKNTLIAGATTAGVAAIGSAVANIAVNKDNKNQAKKIVADYEGMKVAFKKFQQSADERKPKTCSEVHPDLTGNDVNNCTCVKPNYYPTNDGCVQCPPDMTVNSENNGCECKNPNQIKNSTGSACQDPAPQCQYTGLVDNPKSEQCSCKFGATADSNKNCICNTKAGYKEVNGSCECDTDAGYTTTTTRTCVCDPSKHYMQSTTGIGCQLVMPTDKDTSLSASIPADSLFDSGKATIKDPSSLDEFIKKAKESGVDLSNSDEYSLLIVGKTDRQGFKTTSEYHTKNGGNGNQQLSEERANAVKDKLKGTFNEQAIKAIGIAATDCPSNKYPNANTQDCRRVDVVMLPGSWADNLSGTGWMVNMTDSAVQGFAKTEAAAHKVMELLSPNK